MKKSVYKWQGFEFLPDGYLLDQVIDLSTPMGFAYERSCCFYKDFHRHERLLFVFPRDSSEMEIRTREGSRFCIDSRSFLIVPGNFEHDDEGVTTVYDTLALLPEQQLITEVLQKNNFDTRQVHSELQTCRRLERTQWLDQLIQEYFVERIISSAPNVSRQAFFEEEILNEVLKLLLGKPLSDRKPLLARDQTQSVALALKFIEANLFSEIELIRLAEKSHMSVSTLLRKFKKEVGTTPYHYIKNRRLEEALRALKLGKYSVGQVAELVGYSNFGAFTDAFKAQYHKLPSHFLPSKP
jgi:AraC-like DNA-binding protein